MRSILGHLVNVMNKKEAIELLENIDDCFNTVIDMQFFTECNISYSYAMAVLSKRKSVEELMVAYEGLTVLEFLMEFSDKRLVRFNKLKELILSTSSETIKVSKLSSIIGSRR
jgi:hypothetical protein